MDRLLPYQFKIVHIPGKDLGIVDYLSREPNGEPWPELELDEKFVVTSIKNVHKTLDCLNSRFNNHDGLDRNEHILEHSKTEQNVSKLNTSSYGCYGNQIRPKQSRLDRNKHILEHSKTEQNVQSETRHLIVAMATKSDKTNKARPERKRRKIAIVSTRKQSKTGNQFISEL